MPVIRDHTEIRKPADILQRASRPQYNSKHLPQHRDWRYATGVYRHEDIDDTSYRGRELTVWDELDWDVQVGEFGKEKRRRAVKKTVADQSDKNIVEEREAMLLGNEEYLREQKLSIGLDGAMDPDLPPTDGTPGRLVKSDDLGEMLATPNKTVITTPKRILKSVAQAKRSHRRPRSHPDTVTGFQRSEAQPSVEANGSEETWTRTRLVVCLKFSCRGTEKVQQILAEEPIGGQVHAATSRYPGTDHFGELDGLVTPQAVGLDAPNAATPSSTTVSTHVSDTDPTAQAIVRFERQWSDETKNFNMRDVVATLRPQGKEIPPLPDSFNWFPNAVPVDAIFPPGVPLSAKEIMAFYPHHIRWKGVILRLVNNSYLGDTIIDMQAFFRNKDKHPLTITNVNQFFRDALKTDMPDFKLSNFQGRPDRNLYTDHLKPPKLLKRMRYGFVAPRFEDLLEGLVYLPSGVDARGLTQCLAWYLNVRDTFTPRLQMNVLHTQSLIRALCMPLKSYGPQNLDKRALQEWKDNGKFEKRHVDHEVRSFGAKSCDHSSRQLKRSRMTIDHEAEKIGVDVVLKLRHVLTLPYLTIGGMMCRALEMGIEKAEARKASRETQEGSKGPQELETGETHMSEELADMFAKPSQGKEGSTDASNHEEARPHFDSQRPKTITLPSMPTGYKIPKRKRPVLEDSAMEIESTSRFNSSPGVPGAPLGPSAMSMTEHRQTMAPRPLTTSTAARIPSRGPSPFYGPTTTPTSLFGHRHSHAPDHYQSTPNSSTFFGQYRTSPYANTPSHHNSVSHNEVRPGPGWTLVNSPQHHFSDAHLVPTNSARYSDSSPPGRESRNIQNGFDYYRRRQRRE